MNLPPARKIFPVLLAVIALAAASWLDASLGKKAPPSAPVAPSAAVTDCDAFIAKDVRADAQYLKLARLGRGEPCMKPSTWYLKYETPEGARAMEIAFDDGADCTVFGEEADCAQMNPPSGSGTSFEGYPVGAVLRVTRMEFRSPQP